MTGSPTGLDPRDLERVGERRRRRLAGWHASVAGMDDGRPWWGLQIRRLPLGQRIEMAEDPQYHEHWAVRERRLCELDPHHFVWGYGHVQPEDGPPLPFDPWPEQREVLDVLVEELRVVILKARQLGLTWLALHFGYWLQALSAATPNAKILALSKHGGDATKLLSRARQINAMLPPFLRLAEDQETLRSLTRFKLRGRGEMISLAGTPDAARMETATFALADEFAHVKNGNAQPTLAALTPTLGERGKLAVVFTGNGPAEVEGDGQAAAQLYVRATSGESNYAAVFLPSSVHPDRTPEWREEERKNYLSDEDFLAEYPETDDDALAGRQGDKVYPLAGVAAAERLGAEMDARLAAGEMPEPAGASDGALATGFDFGQHSHLLGIWELEGGGIYVPPVEHASFGVEVSRKSAEFLEGLAAHAQRRDPETGAWEPPLAEARYDSAGVEQIRTFVALVQSRPELWRAWRVLRSTSARNPIRIRTTSVRFNRYKSETIDYLRWLFARSDEAVNRGGERWGLIAISPRNPVLLAQLRGLEFKADGSGRIVKVNDHGPDALVAGTAPVAAVNRGRMPPSADEAEDEADRGAGRRARAAA